MRLPKEGYSENQHLFNHKSIPHLLERQYLLGTCSNRQPEKQLHLPFPFAESAKSTTMTKNQQIKANILTPTSSN